MVVSRFHRASLKWHHTLMKKPGCASHCRLTCAGLRSNRHSFWCLFALNLGTGDDKPLLMSEKETLASAGCPNVAASIMNIKDANQPCTDTVGIGIVGGTGLI